MNTDTPFTQDCEDVKKYLIELEYIISDLLPGTTTMFVIEAEKSDTDINMIRADLEVAIKPFEYFYINSIKEHKNRFLCIIGLNITKWWKRRRKIYEHLDT